MLWEILLGIDIGLIALCFAYLVIMSTITNDDIEKLKESMNKMKKFINNMKKSINNAGKKKTEDKPEKPLYYKKHIFCEINGCILEEPYEFQDYQDIGICDEIGEGEAFKYSFIQPVPFTVPEEIEKELKYNNKIHLKHYFDYGDGTERKIIIDKDVYFVRKYDYLKGFGNMLDPIVRYGEEIVEPYMGPVVHILVLVFSLEELPPYEEKKRLEAEYKKKRLDM